MKRPTFFIAGAPRCGTTALYVYLGEHPNIFLPEIKEFHYFASDFPDVQKITLKSDDEYLKMFAGAGEQHLAIGEVSPLYIYSKTALPKIREFNPAAKIILILRNPIDFVQSVHQLNLSLLRDDESDFEKAWRLQDSRKQGINIPSSCREPGLLFYGELGLFGKHVERVFEIFPRKQVHVILFDDFSTNPGAVYENILAFLGVPSDGRQEFLPVNASFENKSKTMAKILHPPKVIYKSFIKLASLFGPNFMKKINVLYGQIEKFNTRRASRHPISPLLKTELQSYFREDIQKLSQLMGRDLSQWTADNKTSRDETA